MLIINSQSFDWTTFSKVPNCSTIVISNVNQWLETNANNSPAYRCKGSILGNVWRYNFKNTLTTTETLQGKLLVSNDRAVNLTNHSKQKYKLQINLVIGM